jgi:hypothetical protein
MLSVNRIWVVQCLTSVCEQFIYIFRREWAPQHRILWDVRQETEVTKLFQKKEHVTVSLVQTAADRIKLWYHVPASMPH